MSTAEKSQETLHHEGYPTLTGVARVADNVYVRRFQRSISGGVDSKKERLKDVRYQEFKEVGPDCVE